MSNKTSQTFECFDLDFGVIQRNYKKSNRILWSFTIYINENLVKVFMEGSEKGLNIKYKDTFKIFLENYPNVINNLKKYISKLESNTNDFNFFLSNEFLIEYISVLSDNYDVILVNSSKDTELTVNLSGLEIVDAFIEKV